MASYGSRSGYRTGGGRRYYRASNAGISFRGQGGNRGLPDRQLGDLIAAGRAELLRGSITARARRDQGRRATSAVGEQHGRHSAPKKSSRERRSLFGKVKEEQTGRSDAASKRCRFRDSGNGAGPASCTSPCTPNRSPSPNSQDVICTDEDDWCTARSSREGDSQTTYPGSDCPDTEPASQDPLDALIDECTRLSYAKRARTDPPREVPSSTEDPEKPSAAVPSDSGTRAPSSSDGVQGDADTHDSDLPSAAAEPGASAEGAKHSTPRPAEVTLNSRMVQNAVDQVWSITDMMFGDFVNFLSDKHPHGWSVRTCCKTVIGPHGEQFPFPIVPGTPPCVHLLKK